MSRATRVLFTCGGNLCRSLMAVVLLRHLTAPASRFSYCGIPPDAVIGLLSRGAAVCLHAGLWIN